MNKKVLVIVLTLSALLASGYFVWTKNQQLLGANTGSTKITHELGTVKIPSQIKKIAVFDYATLDILDTLGVYVAGVAKGSLPQYLGQYRQSDYIDIGTLFEPNYEVLAKMAPDVIFISGRQKEAYTALNAIAPTVYLTVDVSDYLGSLQKNVKLISKMVNKETEAEQKLVKITDEITALKNKTNLKQATGLILLANQGRFSAYGQASRFGVIHNTFGIVPIDTGIETSTHGQTVGYEYLITKNPDYLFVIDRNRVVGGEDCQYMFENELMTHTKAYQAQHIVFLDPEIWYLAAGGLHATAKMITEIDTAVA